MSCKDIREVHTQPGGGRPRTQSHRHNQCCRLAHRNVERTILLKFSQHLHQDDQMWISNKTK